jgi:formate-dependent nitrite reductase membrane component NrfD
MIAMFALGIVLLGAGLMLISTMGANVKDTYNAVDILGAGFFIAGVFFISTGIAYWLGW